MANFYERVAAAAARFPSHHAVELQTADRLEPTTYQQLADGSAAVAAALLDDAVKPGDRIAIIGDNDAGWIATYLGVLRIGAVAVPLDVNYKAAQVATVLDNAGARIIFTTARYAPTVEHALTGVSHLPRVALMDDNVEERPLRSSSAVIPRQEDDAAVILYTSGTTSDPKGVVLTHGNLEAERQAALSLVSLSEHDAVLGVLPLFHSFAQMANLLLPLAVGGRVVFLQNISSTALLEALQKRRISIFACVPQFFYLIHQRVMSEVGKSGWIRRRLFTLMLRTNGWLRARTGLNPGRRWFARVHAVLGDHMRFLVTGGSRFDPGIARDLHDLGFDLLNAYGLTETSGAATAVRLGDRFTTSVGQPLAGVEVRIAPGEGHESEHGDGEILIRGPIVMREYFGRPDATAESIKDGWLHTGDLGRLDADGRLYITGRKKEMIVLASGKNLYPEEIEAHYRETPVIKEICVLGLDRDADASGERLHAVIVPDEDVLRARSIVNVQQLVRFEVEGRSVHLPAHKRILSYDIWMEPLPRTSTGKLRRHQIASQVRDRAATSRQSDTAPLSEADTQWRAAPEHAAAMALIERRLQRTTFHPDANLDLDLGLDSMERVELLTDLERHFGTRVSPDMRATIFTIRQLVEAVLGARTQTARTESAGSPDATWESILAQPADPEFAAQLAHTPWLRAAIFFVAVRTIRYLLMALTGGRVMNRERMPSRGPVIVCPNHQSYLDAFLVAGSIPFAALRQCFAVGASEYYQTPFMRWFARMTNIIPVDADANLERAMQAGATGLRMGRVLLLFPEGERSIDGQLKTFKKGAAILSAHCGAPIVPVAIDGLFTLWPRSRPLRWRGLLPWRATPIRLSFGPSLSAAPGRYVEGTQELREAVATALRELRG